jgi:hypothetical protein
MSVIPMDPWSNKARIAILLVGFGWPALAVVAPSNQNAEWVWVAVGSLFLATIFGVPAVLLGLLLPTYKLRMVVIPILLIALFWAVSSQSAYYQGFALPPYMLLWITTFTAITLVLPQHSSVERTGRRWRRDW